MHPKTYWYKLYKKAIVAGISGNYEVWADKTVANNLVRFSAKQISVIYKGQHLSVNSNTFDRLRICEATNPGISAYIGNDDMVYPAKIEEIEIQLNRFSQSTIFSTHLRHEFQDFCRKINRVPVNEARRIR